MAEVPVQVGPWGPKIGETWSSEIFTHIKKITVLTDGKRIVGGHVYGSTSGGKSHTTHVFGSSTGEMKYSFEFEDDEYLTEMNGAYDDTALTALTFVTNEGTYVVPGIVGTGSFSLPIKGGNIVGLFGYSTSAYNQAIGVYLKPKPN